MPKPAPNIRIAFTSRSLFDLREAHEVFDTQGRAAYIDYLQNEWAANAGPAMSLAQIIYARQEEFMDGQPICEARILMKDNIHTGAVINTKLREYGLENVSSVMTNGNPYTPGIIGNDVDLVITCNEQDAQNLIDLGMSTLLLHAHEGTTYHTHNGRSVANIYWDFDGVIGNTDSEQVYKKDGFEKYIEHEASTGDTPLGKGSCADILAKFTQVNTHLTEQGLDPLVINNVITARGWGHTGTRLFETLRAHGIDINGYTYGQMGESKGARLKSILEDENASPIDLFVDDQQLHIEDVGSYGIPSARVPYRSDDPIHEVL